VALSAILIVLAVAGAGLYLWLNRELTSEIKVENPGGEAGTALVVYHPGRGSFHPRIIAGFVEGLASNGWRVALTTASRQAPTDLSGYDLLVLGSPTYGFAPSRPIRRYLKRLGDLAGQPTVTIITGMGAGGRSTSIIQREVQEANGRLVKALLLYRMRPNDDDAYVDGEQNRARAVEMATQAAREIHR
jgi:hypothetical protein